MMCTCKNAQQQQQQCRFHVKKGERRSMHGYATAHLYDTLKQF